VCKDPKMRTGKHYAEFTLEKGANATVGVCKASLDPRDSSSKLLCTTKDAWGYAARSGLLHHGTSRATTRWTGCKMAREKTAVGLLLNFDTGCLTVYHDGVKIGDMVRTGLKYQDLIWMVSLTDGAEVRIEKKDPPSATGTTGRSSSYSSPRETSRYSTSSYGASSSGEDVRAYMKRVGLDAWYGYFEKHLPANMKSVRTIRSTTSADLRRMATKANMRLDAKTLQQVLDALKKE